MGLQRRAWLVCLVVVTGVQALHKCCPLDTTLSFTGAGFNCTDAGPGDTWRWLPAAALSNETRAMLQSSVHPHPVSYGTPPHCELTSMDVLRFDLANNWAEFSLHVRDHEVRLDVLKDSTFHEPDVGREDSFPPGSFCVDQTAGGFHVVVLCPCREVACVRKCCHDGSVFDKETGACMEVQGDTVNGGDFFDWVPKLDKLKEYYRLVGTVPKCDKFTSHVVTKTLNGSRLLLAQDGSLQDLDSREVYRKDEYCGGHSSENQEMVLFCLKTDPAVAVKRIVYGVMFLVGAISLLATVAVAAILPQMRRNNHGKMALAHNSTLFVGYLTTGVSQLRGSTMSQSGCEAMSLIIQFSILAAFFWLNVMCIDISWTFSGVQPIKGAHQVVERKKFIYYSLYAWGGPVLISTATIIVEYSPGVTSFKPNFGLAMCFFNDRGAELLFFFGPMALLLAVNLLLFIFVACKIPGVHNQTTKTSKNNRNLALYVKLFCLMGVTWVTEVISWAVGGESYLWYFTDLINLLRAVFIFVIFCCKRKVYVMLRDKILRALGKSVQAPATDKNPSHSTKSCYSNESVAGGRAISVANVPEHAERGVPPSVAQTLTSTPKQPSDGFEMRLKESAGPQSISV